MEWTLLVVQTLTALGTIGAALAAVWAVRSSQGAVRQDRDHQVLRDRYEDAVALLAAFEEVEGGERVDWGEKQSGYNVGVEVAARARLRARIRSSREKIPLVRKHCLRDPGTPGSATPSELRQEIVWAIDSLRERLGNDD